MENEVGSPRDVSPVHLSLDLRVIFVFVSSCVTVTVRSPHSSFRVRLRQIVGLLLCPLLSDVLKNLLADRYGLPDNV